MARPEPKICSQKWGKGVPASCVLMVMTEFGDGEGVWAERTEAIAANIRVIVLETRNCIAILPYDAWIVEAAGGCHFGLSVRNTAKLNGVPPPRVKLCKVFIANDLGLDFDGDAVLKSLQSKVTARKVLISLL